MFTQLHFTTCDTDPQFFKSERKRLHKYDPRITMSVYLNNIRRMYKNNSNDEYIKIPFSWQDWVDLSPLNDYLSYDEFEKPSCEDILERGILYDPLDAIEKSNVNKFEEFCTNNDNYFGHVNKKLLPGFNIIKNPGSQFNYLDKIIQAKSYILSTLPQPEALIIMTDDGRFYDVYIDHDKHKTMMENGMFDDFIIEKCGEAIKCSNLGNIFDPSLEMKNLKDEIPASIPKLNFTDIITKDGSFSYHIPKENFRFNPKDLIENLKTKYDDLNPVQKVFLENLERTVGMNPMEAPKTFEEASMDDQEMNGHRVHNIGHHFDFAFFNGFITESKKNFYDSLDEKQKIILHQMLHTWLQFTFHTGTFNSPAHGSLLSWYWNGMIFPWDDDIDVVMPIQDLSDFCMNYNHTLIVQSVNDGYGKYWVECSTSLTVREKANGANNIDARFIDVDSGMYIDITGLAVTGDTGMPDAQRELYQIQKFENSENGHSDELFNIHNEKEIYNCRNEHFFKYEEISPMKLTLMENAPAFVPANTSDSLFIEYENDSLTNIVYQHHIFIEDLQLWIPIKNVVKACRFIGGIVGNNEEDIKKFYLDNREGVVNAMLDDYDVLIEIVKSGNVGRYHKHELNLWSKIEESNLESKNSSYDTKSWQLNYSTLMKKYLEYHKPIRKSRFDYDREVEMLKLGMDLQFENSSKIKKLF
ncbi:Mnn4 protein [Martiniozyma asiatica (nom. inval.)]|nr:Mnn4 protein [Martiniozyma asiatica]